MIRCPLSPDAVISRARELPKEEPMMTVRMVAEMASSCTATFFSCRRGLT